MDTELVSSLYSVTIDITTDCNLKCKHCRLEKIRYNMSLREIEIVCKKLKEYQTNCVFISGGEPTFRKDIVKLIKLVKNYIPVITLNTNATLLNRELIENLINAGVNYFQVSLDGLENEHNEIRGKGNFKKTINNIKLLCEYSDKINVHISCVISMLNINMMEEFVKYLVIKNKFPIQIIGFKRYIPKNEMAGKYNLNKRGLKQLSDNVEYLKTKYGEFTRIVCDFPQKNVLNENGTKRIMEKYNLSCVGCSAAIGGPAIRTDGSVSPCSLLDISYGNIIHDTFENIYESDIFKNLMCRNLTGRCGKCRFKSICGGCRAAAYILTGDYLGEDEECFIVNS